MKLARLAFFSVFLLGFTLLPAPAAAEEGDNLFFRLRSESGDLQALETGVVTYRGSVSGKDVEVALVAAVHVGEKSYYEALNKEFATYDAVLYELVAPEDTDLSRLKDRPKTVLSSLQGSVKELLALDFQLEEIDYSKKNFVHADLSPDAFMSSLSARGDSIWTFLGRALIQSASQQQAESNPLEDMKLVMALLASDDTLRAYKMRRYLAQNFSKVDDLVAQLEGPNGSVLIADRNAKAIEVLLEQIRSTKHRKFAIFYGGAHMPDMERRLLKALPLQRSSNHWIVAWHLQPEAKDAKPAS